MADFTQIDRARKTLGLFEEASMEEIKEAYRELSLKFHPDRCPEKDKTRCEERFKQINRAKDVIMNYCASYKFSFREPEIRKNTMDQETYEHLKRFYDGWFGDLGI